MLSTLSEWFWSPEIWLPAGYQWADLIPNNEVQYAKFEDLLYPIPLAVVLIFIRILLEKTFFYPLGNKLGIKNAKKKVIPNPILEEVYLNKKSKLKYQELQTLSKKVDLEPRQIERWLRKRAFQDKPTKLAKFSESGWRFTCYVLSPIMGIFILWDKPWFWDIKHCWYNFPHHSVTNDVWWYYIYGSSFYWSLMISQFFDNKRKDFWIMFIHHLSTIWLLGFSWACNLTRIGTLVLVLHDCADASLEIAKMTQYANLKKASDILFPLFAIVWIVTRLGIYPVYILNSTLFDAPQIISMFPAVNFFNAMLILLLCLNTFWTWFIVKAVVKAISGAEIGRDARSSTEVSDSESDTISNSTPRKNKPLNGDSPSNCVQNGK